MKPLIERLLEEADDTHKNWYRVASEQQREECRALTLEAAERIRALEAALVNCVEHLEWCTPTGKAAWDLASELIRKSETNSPP